MRSSYLENDVQILLKDITGLVKPLPAHDREKAIQSGVHYCEMLPLEYKPTEKYMEAYNHALTAYAELTAVAVKNVSHKILEQKGDNPVLVSIARAGIPIGILIKRFIKYKFGLDVFHYAISIIRGRGIDHNAVKYILERHDPEQIQFIDGWIGKGAILGELEKDVEIYKGISPSLAVLADPAGITDIWGTQEDFLIPSSCLNATVSGLISRTFLRNDIIGESDFHGAAYYRELEIDDLSYQFINEIEKHFNSGSMLESKDIVPSSTSINNGIDEVKRIAKDFDISDINFIKPGIGEATRVLLRRVPWKILISDKYDSNYYSHIVQLAKEKNVEIIEYPMTFYKACGIIRDLFPDV